MRENSQRHHFEPYQTVVRAKYTASDTLEMPFKLDFEVSGGDTHKGPPVAQAFSYHPQKVLLWKRHFTVRISLRVFSLCFFSRFAC